MTEIVAYYQGVALFHIQYEAMKELEELLGMPIPLLKSVDDNSFGFVADDGRIQKLALNQRGISMLPENFTDLSTLQELYMNDNQLISYAVFCFKKKILKILSVRFN